MCTFKNLYFFFEKTSGNPVSLTSNLIKKIVVYTKIKK